MKATRACGSTAFELGVSASAIVQDSAEARLDINALYRNHAQFLARILARLTGDPGSVEDLLQETFLVAFRKRDQYDDAASERAWLYGIASRLALQHRRSRRRFGLFRQRLEVEPATPPPSPPQDVEVAQNRARLYTALQALPAAQREAVVLYELEGLEGTAASKLLAIPEGTFWTRLHHGRKKLVVALRRELRKESKR